MSFEPDEGYESYYLLMYLHISTLFIDIFSDFDIIY